MEELVAERDIRRLLALYPRYADDLDAQAFAELFTPTGRIDVAGRVTEGREAIASWLPAAAGGNQTRHIMVNSFISVTSAEEAHGTTDMALLMWRDGQWVLSGSPRYTDRYEKIPEGWRFAERSIAMRAGAPAT